ncbi:PREDICTED: putative F-box only protein 15 [Camelina sativa]|uniref:F-box only protein 15 n=1 Tax=Camelina sativa TaxID=90675 RepID=A0ABM0WA83_CAMSA|nr:PREDICTED: putative F-box only protein 15 [Camelina sativa]
MEETSKRSLPPELIEEILSRTPAESLNRFKSTCKQWYDLITDKRFMYNHLDRSPERFIRIDDRQTVQIMDPVTGIHKDSPIPDMFHEPYLSVSMVHCDGLMLCMCHDSSFRHIRGATLAVWNPVTRKIKWIEPLACYSGADFFGIGYDNTCRHNYKILRFSGPLSVGDPECEIYEFKSDSWRTLGAKFDWAVDTQCRGVSLKGNMYWIAKRKEKEEFIILKFDFSMETFKDICVCPCCKYRQDRYVCPNCKTRSLGCFKGDRLSLLLQHGEGSSMDIEVFVTNKLSDRVVSFSRYFNVTRPHLPALQYYFKKSLPGHYIGKHNSIMIYGVRLVKKKDEKWCTCIILYQIDEGGIRKQIETGRHEALQSYICSYAYVPSLIPVPE